MHGFSNLHSGPHRPSSQLHLLGGNIISFTQFEPNIRSTLSPKWSRRIHTVTFVSTLDLVDNALVDVIFTIHTFESRSLTLAFVMTNQINATATILTGTRFALIDVRFAMHASVTKTARTWRRIIGGQTKATILAWFVFTKRFVAKSSLISGFTSAREIVARCSIWLDKDCN